MNRNKKGKKEQNSFLQMYRMFEGENPEKSVEKKKKKKKKDHTRVATASSESQEVLNLEGEGQEKSVKKKKMNTKYKIAPKKRRKQASSLGALERCPTYYEAQGNCSMKGGKNSGGFTGQKIEGEGNPNVYGHETHQKCEEAGEINASDSKNYHKHKFGHTFSNKEHWKDKKSQRKWKEKSVKEILRVEHILEKKLRNQFGRTNEKRRRHMLIEARQARARGLCLE
ncbi:uncharacterized protein LOC135202171 isoform X2 [Macrobrachium nipponense]|uniref:uncharacterized protein LOC135202171 isoform X2 n=1 Tax=Macrobrachium nipponense TaxID=159736 RepID=UPI0030C8BA82